MCKEFILSLVLSRCFVSGVVVVNVVFVIVIKEDFDICFVGLLE